MGDIKVVLVGSSGHFDLALKVFDRRSEVVFTGYAAGTPEEDDGEFVRRYGNTYGFSEYKDYIRMFEELKPDVAVINSHYHLNAAITTEAIKRGIRCFTEKPLATTLEALELLKEQYCKTPADLCAMLALRCNPAFRAAYEYIKQGGIGEPLIVTAQKSYKLGQRKEFYKHRDTYGGTIPWVGIHAIDWIRWLSGLEPVSVYACHSTLSNNGHNDLETVALCQFKLENGGIASANIDYLRPGTASTHGDDRARAAGSRGVVEVRGGKAYAIDAYGEHELPLEDTPNLFESFINQVKGLGACAVSAEDSFRTTEIALKARQSADEGREILLRGQKSC